MPATAQRLDTPIGQAIASLTEVVAAGGPCVDSSKPAIEGIEAVEQARRLTAVAAVDVIASIEGSRSFYDHGHASARVMYAHIAGVGLFAEVSRVVPSNRIV